MMYQIFFEVALLVFFYMTGAFLLAVYKKDNSIADSAWGLGFVLVAWYTLIKNGLYLPRHILVTLLVTLWGVRLASHITWRNWGKPEDQRYVQLAKEWKQYFLLQTYLKIFLLQGALLFVISLPVIFVNSSSVDGLRILDLIGTVIWAVGFWFETVADYQLLRFLSNPLNRGKIMRAGLWRYSRHPNYFGEVAMWWGIYLISRNVPYAWIGVLSPITITVLLLFVSGIAMAEKMFEDHPDYEEYKKRTSIFIPWFPRGG